jgi:GDSL-like Lipase/Acylhydrolase family
MQETPWLVPALAEKSARGFFKTHRRAVSLGVLLVCAGLAGLEAVCRSLGLHTPVLYERTSYGFRPAPNQDILRFGNHIFYDALGLRSPPVAANPAPGTLRILFLGDSVTNGGTVTDQADTLPYRLQEIMNAAGQEAEVLSASSPGWAVGNEAGWLNHFGTLGAKYLVLTLNSYDLFQPAAPASTVGLHPSFPSSAPWLGIQELLARYVIPKLLGGQPAPDPGAEASAGGEHLSGAILGDLRWILLRAQHQNTEPILVFVSTTGARSMQDAATMEAKRKVTQLVSQLRVPMIETSGPMHEAGGAALFRDGLHPNPRGNEVIAKIVGEYLLSVHASGRQR